MKPRPIDKLLRPEALIAQSRRAEREATLAARRKKEAARGTRRK